MWAALGLTLDRRLTFNAHIADLKQRCSRRINILKCIAGREWGADRRTLLHLYTTLIRPILDFNAFLFGIYILGRYRETKYLYREFSDKFMHEAFRPSA